MTPIKHIGFTGTQLGMTLYQKAQVKLYLMSQVACNDVYFHHGDCIGADAEAAKIARDLGCRVICHPPLNDKKRAFFKSDEYRKERHYLDRNRDIVDESYIMMACPKEYEQVMRSGTWATIRYARKVPKKILIIYPTGDENV